jgi:hypothetical protein
LVFAEESRIFTLPFLLLFPLLGKTCYELFTDFYKKFDIIIGLFSLLFSVVIYFSFSFLYSLTTINSMDNFFIEYNTISVFFVSYFVLIQLFKRKKEV